MDVLGCPGRAVNPEGFWGPPRGPAVTPGNFGVLGPLGGVGVPLGGKLGALPPPPVLGSPQGPCCGCS